MTQLAATQRQRSSSGCTLEQTQIKRQTNVLYDFFSYPHDGHAILFAEMLSIAMTTLEKLQLVPTRFWANALMLIAFGFIAIFLVRHAAEMNRALLSLIIVLMSTTVGFHWVYGRTAPAAFSPSSN